jgi:sterol 3beta-glucosyltransferase
MGFGSMSSRNPQETQTLIVDALAQVDARAVVASGWGLSEGNPVPANVFVISSVPHTWLFPHVAAVIHHGGAGTTAAGLRAGKPTMIIPHMFDQPYWGRRVHELGVGVKPAPRHRLTADVLAAGIRQLLGDSAISERAQILAEQIRAEDGVAWAVAVINAFGEENIVH